MTENEGDCVECIRKGFLIKLNPNSQFDIGRKVRERLQLKDGDVVRVTVEKVSKGKGVRI